VWGGIIPRHAIEPSHIYILTHLDRPHLTDRRTAGRTSKWIPCADSSIPCMDQSTPSTQLDSPIQPAPRASKGSAAQDPKALPHHATPRHAHSIHPSIHPYINQSINRLESLTHSPIRPRARGGIGLQLAGDLVPTAHRRLACCLMLLWLSVNSGLPV